MLVLLRLVLGGALLDRWWDLLCDGVFAWHLVCDFFVGIIYAVLLLVLQFEWIFLRLLVFSVVLVVELWLWVR